MPSPTTTDELLDLVERSAVVEDKRLSAYVDKARADGGLPADARDTANLLVRDGILTNFQAEQILQGKWKRFTIGKYKVLEKLGSGGMGAVYLCEHKLMRRRVAIKVLPAAKASDASSLERFYREARAVAALDHPNIVRAYDIDQDDKLHFLVMEHVDGASLQEIIKRTGPMDVLRACHYICQATLGLQHAHDAAALVHRDIKPGNILVDRNGIVKILDMGLARFFHDEEDMITKKFDENVLGTADYLAPEQATDSHAVDIRADIYSLGATFYFCLTGRTPFQEGTIAQKLIWHQTRLPKPIRSFRPDVPEGVIAIIDKAMSKDVADRYQSPQEMGEALSEWTKTPIPPPPEEEMPKLSLAALGAGTENNVICSPKSSNGPLSPPPRKHWQVPVSSPRVSPKPNPSPLTHTGARAAPTRPGVPIPAATQQAIYKLQDETHEQTSGAVTTPAIPKDRPKTTEKSSPKLKAPPSALDLLAKRPLLIFVAVALLVMGVLAVGSALTYVFWPKTPAPSTTTVRVPKVFTKEHPSDFKTFLESAGNGDHVIVEDDVVASDVTITAKNLTIEGKNITWSYPVAPTPANGTLLRTNGAEGLLIKGITFDGRDRAKTLIDLFGHSPGLTLRDLQFKNFKSYGILIKNCEGSFEKYIEMSDLSFKMTSRNQIALFFDIDDKMPTIPVNRYFRIRDDCTFDAPPGIPARKAPKTEVKNADLSKKLQEFIGK